jgi:hypothetical protein
MRLIATADKEDPYAGNCLGLLGAGESRAYHKRHSDCDKPKEFHLEPYFGLSILR